MQAGRVRVNGIVTREPGTRVDPARDEVTLDGQVLRLRRKLYVALHKPAGYVCSRRPQGRQAGVLELLPPEWRGLYPVGRLDRDSEGLLLLTNDGEFCLRLTHPRHGVAKLYEATVTGRVTPERLAPLTRGLRHRGELLRAEQVRVTRAGARRSRVEVLLREGKNREVRRLFAAVGLHVERLIRRRIGSLRLGELPPGRWRVLSAHEVRALAGKGRGKSEAPKDRGTEGNPKPAIRNPKKPALLRRPDNGTEGPPGSARALRSRPPQRRPARRSGRSQEGRTPGTKAPFRRVEEPGGTPASTRGTQAPPGGRFPSSSCASW